MWCEKCNAGRDGCKCGEVQPQPGDKVHVVVHRPVEFDATVISLEPGWMHLVDEEGAERSLELPGAYPSAITVTERADDPANDPIGTIAELDRGNGTVVYVKMIGSRWIPVDRLPVGHTLDSDMRGRVVTGAVPGTPADFAQDTAERIARLRPDAESAASGNYDPKGPLGGVVYTTCLNCGFGAAAHGVVVGP